MKSKRKFRNPVLVRGGAGYIGAHACKALAGAGYTPAYPSLDSIVATAWQWHQTNYAHKG